MRQFLICMMMSVAVLSLNAQEPFNGIVYDAQAKPVKNARIYTGNPDRYALSDKEGRFGLTDVQPDDTVRVKLKNRKQAYVIPVEGRKSMKIFLADENVRAEEDDELVSFGYGFVKKRESTGVRNGISGDVLVQTGMKDVLSALQGKVPGLDITPSGVTIRGVRSLTLSSEPLYIVDGVFVMDFNGINLHDVDYVEVMKDASIYGSRGANGAIIVHTKTGGKRK